MPPKKRKVRTRPWDPAEHINDGGQVIAFLKAAVSPAEYDPDITPHFLDCISRSKGKHDIALVVFHDTRRQADAITVTTVQGQTEKIPVAGQVSLTSIMQALDTGSARTVRKTCANPGPARPPAGQPRPGVPITGPRQRR